MTHGYQDTLHTPSLTESLAFRFTVFVIALLLRFVCVAEGTANTIHFKSPHRYLIVVSVRVNGVGPYSFLLDTGATSSAIDPELSASLHLSAAQSAKLASWNDTTDARRVLVQSLSLGPIDSGPLSVLVQPLTQFKAFDSHLRGVLGQDVLLHTNYLIDNRHHRIQFDNDDTLLAELTGDHIRISPVLTREGALATRLIAVPVNSGVGTEPLHLLLDSGADMVVLQPDVVPPGKVPIGTKWIADENGKNSAATSFHTVLSVGSQAFSAEAWIGKTGLKQLAIDGLLPTGPFDQLYIANHDCFVIFDPGHAPHNHSGR